MSYYANRKNRVTPRIGKLYSGSPVLSTILYYVYRKHDSAKLIGEEMIDKLVNMGLLKKVTSKGINYYFKEPRAQTYRAIDLAKEYLWEHWNPQFRKEVDGKKHIYCFSSKIENGRGLVEIETAIKKGIV